MTNTTHEAPERLAFRKKYMSLAIRNGPLMDHPDYIQYTRADLVQAAVAERDALAEKLAKALEALGLADAALSGANMNMRVVERKVKAAIASLRETPHD